MPIRRARLSTGLVLFLFIFTHLLNHVLGLVSLQAAEEGRVVFLAAWRSLPGTAIFYGALFIHVSLALLALYERHTLRMPLLEATRYVVGLCIPLLLAAHFASTRLAHQLHGVDDLYARVVPAIGSSGGWLRQFVLVVVAWLHGCLGIHFVLRHRAAYRKWFHLTFAAMVMLPVLAMLGFLTMAREVRMVDADTVASTASERAADEDDLRPVSDRIMLGFLGLVSVTLVLRAARLRRQRRAGRLVRISYPQRTVEVPLGWSVLEASRAHGVPHVSLCGGRGRCSTCRVRVSGSATLLAAAEKAELRTLRRVGAAADIRLACQFRPTADVKVTPLLSSRSARNAPSGMEREIVVLFVDLRRWSTLSEQHLPHDLSYVLDHFFEIVGSAVRAAGGIPNQFIGDSVMAIFGLETDVPTACRQSLAAAQAIEAGMDGARDRLQQEFGASLDFGIGLHVGHAAVGEVGWRETRTFSAVGDTVNTAARLQELCKEFAVRLVVSEPVLQAAGVRLAPELCRSIEIRGRSSPLRVHAIGSPGQQLPGVASDARPR